MLSFKEDAFLLECVENPVHLGDTAKSSELMP